MTPPQKGSNNTTDTQLTIITNRRQYWQQPNQVGQRSAHVTKCTNKHIPHPSRTTKSAAARRRMRISLNWRGWKSRRGGGGLNGGDELAAQGKNYTIRKRGMTGRLNTHPPTSHQIFITIMISQYHDCGGVERSVKLTTSKKITRRQRNHFSLGYPGPLPPRGILTEISSPVPPWRSGRLVMRPKPLVI